VSLQFSVQNGNIEQALTQYFFDWLCPSISVRAHPISSMSVEVSAPFLVFLPAKIYGFFFKQKVLVSSVLCVCKFLMFCVPIGSSDIRPIEAWVC